MGPFSIQLRFWPSPLTIQVVVVIASSPMGPRARRFWLDIPISAPKLICSPSVNRVEVLTMTAAQSESAMKRLAAASDSVTIASVCWVPYSAANGLG